MATAAPRPHPTTAWIDASVGVAGDMLLGALVDSGASLEVVTAAVEAVIPGTVRLSSHETTRAGLRALKVEVELLHEDQHHRRWSEVRALITGAGLAPGVAERALAAFESLARAEAEVHGTDVEDVHFHEVGAWDSIADVVGTSAALADLVVTDVVASVIATGTGSVRGAHGRIAVPVPAVLALSRGWAVDAVGDGELATPTGVALLTSLASRQGPLPAMQVERTGVGAGTKDVEGRANVVRVVLGRPVSGLASIEETEVEETDVEVADMVVLEANVDDLDPRVWPTVITRLLGSGAADAWLTPILMKKGRPAHTLSVLAHPQDAPSLRDLVLAETSTIGVRQTPVRRWALPRLWVDLYVLGERVAVKVAHRGGRIVHATPEFRDVEAAAEALGLPVREVLERAVAAATADGLVPGAPRTGVNAPFRGERPEPG